MCGRFEVDLSIDELRTICAEVAERVEKALNIGKPEVLPTDSAPVLIRNGDHNEMRVMAWGFPKLGGKEVMFNARRETDANTPVLRDALRETPAAVPTSGFFEWKAVPGERKKRNTASAPLPNLFSDSPGPAKSFMKPTA